MTEQTKLVPDGRVEINGDICMGDGRGGWLPVRFIKPQRLLEDETVRKIMGFALALSAQVARFKGHTFEDLGALDDILMQHYGVTKGGPKGNRTYQTVDGLMRIQVKVNDLLDFGPELQVAKLLIDECMNDWSANSRPEARAIITRTFSTDKEGQVNRALLFTLLSMDFEEPRWQRAMEAVRDAIRVVGTRTYYTIQMRDDIEQAFTTVTIDLAKA